MQEVRKSVINASETKFQVVKLEEKFFRMGNIKELFAYFSENNVTLKRVQADKVKDFIMSAQAADDFVAVWTAFRSECTNVDKEEVDRRVGVAFEVTAICSHYPEIIIQKHQGYNGGEYWSVTVEKLNGYYNNEIHTIDQLLTEVQEVKERLDARKAAFKQVKDILATNPEITIKSRDDNREERYVNAAFKEWTMHIKYAEGHVELLDQVLAAVTELTEAQEAYRIAGENGLLITKMGSGWVVRTLETKQEKNLYSHTSGDLLAYVIAVTTNAHGEIPVQCEPPALTPIFSEDEMSLLQAAQAHLDAE